MERAIPVLPVTDLDVAKAFYVDGLGFDVRFNVRTGEDGDTTTGLLGVELGGIVVTLDCPMSGHGRDACVSLEVADADVYYNRWRERVSIERAPQNEPWGARTFSVHDPFGNTIFVMGPVKDDTDA
ncbi:MAG: VOC family protein [Gemmatimonadaceae bacterium]|nr:VOC family protein [Gemmatimonadaceae bacterium]